jgi:hypothetical protein
VTQQPESGRTLRSLARDIGEELVDRGAFAHARP